MFQTKKWMKVWDRWMIAITFAEAGQREMALDALDEKPRRTRRTAVTKRKNREQRPVLMP